jgi:hypothetical protein
MPFSVGRLYVEKYFDEKAKIAVRFPQISNYD